MTTVRLAGLRPRRPTRYAFCVLMVLAAVVATLPGAAAAEQASQPSSPAAGYLTTGKYHSCALQSGAVRCWGFGGEGELGYGNTKIIGDDETPGSVGPVDLGPGRTATAISAGSGHTCAILDNGRVLCWGFGANGRLGYGNTDNIGDNETPASAGPVNLGAGHTAKAISAGDGHTCAILDDDTVRCWGYGFDGRLGYNSLSNVGDTTTPASVGPVNFGGGHTAKAISAGNAHTCAILDDNTVRCWGFAGGGRLGYANLENVGRGCLLVDNICAPPDPNAPRTDTVGPVNLGPGRTAKAISAGQFHTCAVLDDNTVRCWGLGASGRLGYGNADNIGDDEPPGSVGPVNVGTGRTAKSVTAGGDSSCAILDNDNVRCWGFGAFGALGYGNADNVGDSLLPGSAGPVDLGSGRTAKSVTVGDIHACARLDNDSVRCWGYGANGRLGYCNSRTIGDNETPGSAGPVDLGTPAGGARCPSAGGAGTGTAPGTTPAQTGGGTYAVDPSASEAARLGGLRSCLAKVKGHARREVRRARHLSGGRRALALRHALRHARRHRRQLRRRCLKRYGRTPGRVTGLKARAKSRGRVVLTFKAAGSDGSSSPAARTYLIKQSRRPIRTARAFRRADSLCKGECSFKVTLVGDPITLTVTKLRRRTVYYYAIKARDNVSKRTGPRSRTVKARIP